jgi:hypothetical protein
MNSAVRWSGKDGKEVIDSTEKGLRIQLPATRTGKTPVGPELRTRIEGDVEITAGYELLQTDQPKTGSGVGVELFAMLDGPTQDGLALARIKEKSGEDVYKFSHNTTVDRRRRFNVRSTPSTAKFGQLRISRKGRIVTFLAADEGGEFRPLQSYEIDPTFVKYIRIAAYPGESTQPVEVRLLDLKITSNDDVGMQALIDPAIVSTNEAQAGVSGGWLAAVEIIALTVLLTLLGLGVWIWFRRRRPEENAPRTDVPRSRADY